MFQFVSPKQVYHDKTGSIVEMFRFGTKKQLFYIRKCRKTRPIVTVSDTARCRTEIMLHLAYIKVETSQYRRNHKLYRHCVPHLNYYVCDDWIRLLGFCTLFIGGWKARFILLCLDATSWKEQIWKEEDPRRSTYNDSIQKFFSRLNGTFKHNMLWDITI